MIESLKEGQSKKPWSGNAKYRQRF